MIPHSVNSTCLITFKIHLLLAQLEPKFEDNTKLTNTKSLIKVKQPKFTKLLSPVESYLRSSENEKEQNINSSFKSKFGLKLKRLGMNFYFPSKLMWKFLDLEIETDNKNQIKNEILDALSPLKNSYMKFRQSTRQPIKSFSQSREYK